MELLIACIGFAVGFGLAWMIFKPKPGAASAQDDLSNQLLAAVRESSAYKGSTEVLLKEKEALAAGNQRQQETIVELHSKLSAMEESKANVEQRLAEQKAELEEIRAQFTKEFENLANRILEEKTKKFTEQNKTGLDDILRPFQERIREFEEKVNKAYDTEMRDKISLREEVKKLYELNARISEEAHNLTKALKGDNKTQGNWGELILERVLERSGLVKDREYRTQVVTRNAGDEVIKPDVVVFLPDNKHLIIDAKVSLTAYEQLVNSTDTNDQERLMKEHVASVRGHVKLLSDKNYYSSEEFSTPDFVLLFMPLESAFSLAIQFDPELFNYAWDRRCVIVSPTTLLATLRTVSGLWKFEYQNRNANEIARQAGMMLEKFEGFVKDLIEVGKKMDDSKKAYEESMKKLSTGNGNLVRKAQQLKELGAKTDKSLPQSLLDRAMDSSADA